MKSAIGGALAAAAQLVRIAVTITSSSAVASELGAVDWACARADATLNESAEPRITVFFMNPPWTRLLAALYALEIGYRC